MIRLTVVLLLALLGQGCIAQSDAYYQAQVEMWKAKAEVSKAWATKGQATLAEFVTPEGYTFRVNNPNPTTPMEIHDEPNPWVEGLKVASNSTGLNVLLGSIGIDKLMSNVQGNYEAAGDINVTRDSGNTSTLDMVSLDSGSSTTEQSYANSGNTDQHNTTDSHDQTATPTVVNPVVVQTTNP